jgi:hypothetical protein
VSWTGATTTQWKRSLPSITARADATAEKSLNPDTAQQQLPPLGGIEHSTRSLDSAQQPLPEAPLGGFERSPRNSLTAQEQLLPSVGIEHSPPAQNLNVDTTQQQQLPPLVALLPLGGIDSADISMAHSGEPPGILRVDSPDAHM